MQTPSIQGEHPVSVPFHNRFNRFWYFFNPNPWVSKGSTHFSQEIRAKVSDLSTKGEDTFLMMERASPSSTIFQKPSSVARDKAWSQAQASAIYRLDTFECGRLVEEETDGMDTLKASSSSTYRVIKLPISNGDCTTFS